jgi:uncharacterized OB-fold protein
MTDTSSSRLAGTARRDERSGPWFDALADGSLVIHRCRDCGHVSRPDTASCPACQSEDLEWFRAGGGGTVVSLIRDYSGGEPLVLALVELDEGPWLHARLTDFPEGTIGCRVTLTVLPPDGDDGEHVPAFTRAT